MLDRRSLFAQLLALPIVAPFLRKPAATASEDEPETEPGYFALSAEFKLPDLPGLLFECVVWDRMDPPKGLDTYPWPGGGARFSWTLTNPETGELAFPGMARPSVGGDVLIEQAIELVQVRL